MSQKQYLARLNCSHVQNATLREFVQRKMSCSICGEDSRTIVAVDTWEYNAKCYDCRFRRWTATSQQTARELANGHRRKRPTHRTAFDKSQRPESVALIKKLKGYGIDLPEF